MTPLCNAKHYKCGVRQGCPLSGVLFFVIAVKNLANLIRNDKLITGINFKGREYTRVSSPLAFLPRCSWESISKYTARTKNEIENEILWKNHEVTIGGKSVFMSNGMMLPSRPCQTS